MPILLNYPQTETLAFSGVDTVVPAGTTLSFFAFDATGTPTSLGTTTTNGDGSYAFSTTVPFVNYPEVEMNFFGGGINELSNSTFGNSSLNMTETTTLNFGVVSVGDRVDPTSAAVTKNETVTPFAHAGVGDTVPTETISAQITLSSGYSTSSPLSVSGTATQVQTFLDGFTAKALSNGPGQITATVTAADGSNAGSVTFNGTAPGGSGLQSPTSAQITTLTNDTIKFYIDAEHGASTTGDATKMVNDLSGLSIDKPTLAGLLSAALKGDTGTNAGTLGSDLANISYGLINNDLQSQSPNLGADLTNMINEAVAVGGTYSGLVATESASKALAATVSQYHLS